MVHYKHDVNAFKIYIYAGMKYIYNFINNVFYFCML